MIRQLGSISWWLVGLVLLLACGPLDAREPAFRLEPLTGGVILLRPVDGRGDLSNSLLVRRQDGLLVVEAQADPSRAAELLATIDASSDRPLRYLVLSHAHAESAGGASGFPDSVIRVASREFQRTLLNPGFEFLAETRKRIPGLKRPPTPEVTLVVFGRTWLDDPEHRVELMPLAAAHGAGDLALWLPESRVLYAGALLVTDGAPYGRDADIDGWIAALDLFDRLEPAIVVPLRGPAVDRRYLRARKQDLIWLRGQVELRLIDGKSTDRIVEEILDDAELAERFEPGRPAGFVAGWIRAAAEQGAARIRDARR